MKKHSQFRKITYEKLLLVAFCSQLILAIVITCNKVISQQFNFKLSVAAVELSCTLTGSVASSKHAFNTNPTGVR